MESIVLDNANEPKTAVPVARLLETVDWAAGPVGSKSDWPAFFKLRSAS